MRFGHEELVTFSTAAARAAGVADAGARDLAEVLVEAELRGISTHGLRRLPAYLGRVRSHAIDGGAEPIVAQRDPAAVVVDGRNAIGPHAAIVAADAVAASARKTGVAVATVRNGNHFAFAGYYATRIAAHGMVAMVLSNGTPSIAPPGSTLPFLCNSPIAIGAPFDGELFVEFDMATSVTSRDHLRRAAERGEPIPSGWALDAEGSLTTDAAAGMAGTMLPVGGPRGFGLVFALEVLTGVLAGAAVADEVPSKDLDPHARERLGHWMLAVQVSSFVDAGEFAERLQHMVARMVTAPRRPRADEPRFPGQRRWETRHERLRNGVPVDPVTVAALDALADDLGVERLARPGGQGTP